MNQFAIMNREYMKNESTNTETREKKQSVKLKEEQNLYDHLCLRLDRYKSVIY